MLSMESPCRFLRNLIKMKRVLFILLLSISVILTICCSKKNKSTNPDSKEPNFAIQVSPQTQWVTAGDSTEFKIKLTSLNSFSSPCTLSLVGSPEGDSITLGSEVLVPTDSCRLTLYTTFSTSRDTYQLSITGKNKNLIHSTQATLVVSPEKVTDYYPLAIGNSWTYALLGPDGRIWDTFSYKIVDTATVNNNFCYLTSDIMFFYVKGDTIFSLAPRNMESVIVLVGPLVIGHSWTVNNWNYELIEFGAVTLTKGTEYQNCIKLRKTDPAHPQAWEYEWWAKSVGQVKWDTYAYGQYQGSKELVSFIHP
jgi:hypothetical protein